MPDRTATRTVLETALYLTAETIPVVVLQPGLKRPIEARDGGWLTIDNPDEVDTVFAKVPADANLGCLLDGKKDSRLVLVDVDGPGAWDTLRSLGVSSADPCWITRTGKGDTHIYYHRPSGDRLLRIGQRQTGIPLDLLTDGYGVLPPSDTSRERKGGGPYRWIPGHGPWDIPLSRLCEPPTPLVEWWRDLGRHASSPPSPDTSDSLESPLGIRAWHLAAQPISEGQRNDTLTRIAGWLRLYHPEPMVLTLLQAINEARCQPPLSEREIEAIVRSVCRYPQPGVNGHPRAVVPSYTRETDHAVGTAWCRAHTSFRRTTARSRFET